MRITQNITKYYKKITKSGKSVVNTQKMEEKMVKMHKNGGNYKTKLVSCGIDICNNRSIIQA